MLAATTALSSTELTISPTGMISVYTANSDRIATHTAVVTVGLISYPSVSTIHVSFEIEIIGCIITGFTMSAMSPTHDKTYTISDPAFTWNLGPSSYTT